MIDSTDHVEVRYGTKNSHVVQFLLDSSCYEDKSQRKGFTQSELLRFAVDVVNRGDVGDLGFVEALQFAISADLKGERVNDIQLAIAVSLECAKYYQYVDALDNALDTCNASLKWSLAINDEALERRSYGLLGATYVRLSDFHKAFDCLEKAYNLANRLNDRVAVFATLANTVAVIETMGLFDEAMRLALDLSLSQPWGEEKLDYLHLCNANNGLRMSQRLNDDKNSRKFYKVASKAFKASRGYADDITKAHFNAAEIVHLVKCGQLNGAHKLTVSALQENGIKRNTQVQSLLICAQASLHVATGSIEDIEQSCLEAQSLLSLTINSSDHYEELLRALILLFTTLEKLRGNVKPCGSELYRQILKRHILSVKHRHYFTHVAKNISEWDERSDACLGAPSYFLPSWILEASELYTNARNLRSFNSLGRVGISPKEIAEFGGNDATFGLRSLHFVHAENWALAAEMTFGGMGQHCMLVGRIAAAIAEKIGFSKPYIERLELACRLHDIGTIAGDIWKLPINERRAFGKLSTFCEHSLYGERMLLASCDETLQLGARIARSHHECWNGCGYPDGLIGDAIPIEARLCAVADTFVSLVVPARDYIAWNYKQAVAQIESMSGMQLDPQIVSVFISVVENTNHIEDFTALAELVTIQQLPATLMQI